ncbi:MAG TPA: MCE family protein [Prolixibacteraceae bacterium]|nr:MCE family protein [Prolixibacteraceae bacterium]
MNESSNKRAVIVGVFVFIGLVFLLSGVLIVGNLRETFNRKMELVSLFDDISGLQPGNNIWFSGVKIGTVSNLNFYGKSQVKVIMKVATTARQYIRKDAKVKLGNDGLIGNKILVIYGGTEAFAEVQEGDTLEVEKTFTSEDMINTAQENNKNILVITNDVKAITKKLAAGEGSLGKLLNDSLLYANINTTIVSLQDASAKAQQMLGSLAEFSSGLNKKGTLANELTTDTVVFKSVKASVLELQQIADTASVFITGLKNAANNRKTSIGVLLHDEEAGAHIKASLKNLESSSKKLDEDLEAAQHNILLRGFFKKKAKAAERDSIGE